MITFKQVLDDLIKSSKPESNAADWQKAKDDEAKRLERIHLDYLDRKSGARDL